MNTTIQRIKSKCPFMEPIITYITTYIQPNVEKRPIGESSESYSTGPNYFTIDTNITEDTITTIIRDSYIERNQNCSFPV